MNDDTNAWTDEMLMACADGELDAAQYAALDRALAADAALRARVAALRSQRQRVEAAFADALDEAVPDRLSALLADTPRVRVDNVVSLEPVRAERAARHGVAPSWAQWGGMAASVVLGLLIGLQWSRSDGDAIDVRRDGRVVAGGPVAQALSTQLAGAGNPDPAVAVQLSFVDRDGSYCRTFSTAAVAGLACRQDGMWAVQMLTRTTAGPAGAMRQAASALPRAVLDAVDQRIAGDALDAERERAAREQGWQRR